MEEFYDLEAVYDEQISPLMQQIIEICKQHKMPMLCSFAFEHCEENGVGDCTTLLNFDGRTHGPFTAALRTIRNSPTVAAFTIRTGTTEQGGNNA